MNGPSGTPRITQYPTTGLDGVQDTYSTRGVCYGKRAGVFYDAPYYLHHPTYCYITTGVHYSKRGVSCYVPYYCLYCPTYDPTLLFITVCQLLHIVHADWLIVATVPSYHGSIPYGLFYHACTKPTGPTYTVLACSQLCSKTIGINERCQSHHF